MIHSLDPAALAQLATALSGTYSMTLCEGRVRLLCRSLPDRWVCAAKHVGDVLYVFVDLDKPRAIHEAWDMIQDWRASFVEPQVSNRGVELVPLPRLPEPVGPCPLSLA